MQSTLNIHGFSIPEFNVYGTSSEKKIFMRFQKAKSEFASTSKLYVNTQNLHISYTSMSNLQVI